MDLLYSHCYFHYLPLDKNIVQGFLLSLSFSICMQHVNVGKEVISVYFNLFTFNILSLDDIVTMIMLCISCVSFVAPSMTFIALFVLLLF